MTANNEITINIRQVGWCGVSMAEPDAHYIYSVIGRNFRGGHFSLCRLSDAIMEHSVLTLIPPQLTKCEACVEIIKNETKSVATPIYNETMRM